MAVNKMPSFYELGIDVNSGPIFVIIVVIHYATDKTASSKSENCPDAECNECL
jgi:hypothetical protein